MYNCLLISVKFFPHSASDVVPTFEFLLSLPNDADWMMTFVSLLACSMVALIPFKLETIDQNIFEEVNEL